MNKYEFLNKMNNVYDCYGFEITCLDEAQHFSDNLYDMYLIGKVKEIHMNNVHKITENWSKYK